ncbi:MAG: phosphoribosylformylglycinamidine cyclo-ligase [Nitrospirae bacterium]|nr:phosphoribosylformylglycinamidine cyclo-ligase [Nitrospirota bacterium]
MTYKDSGVDVRSADSFVGDIKTIAKKTFRKEVLTDIGSFNALFALDWKKYRDPVLVSGTDGVGTKLKVAFMAGRHDTIGIDLVAMCVNDILTAGAEPLFFLDYFAVSHLDKTVARQVLEGIAEGCIQAGCSLIGGETAEMPGFYSQGEYDLSGFAVGIAERSAIVDGSAIKPGDSLIGLPSSGLHSNGYSMVRKLFFELEKMGIHDIIPETGTPLSEELLTPTTIYVKAIHSLMEKVRVKGMAHVTGGGITGNLPRILPNGTGARIRTSSWEVPPIFKAIRQRGSVVEDEMNETFNMGVGFIAAISSEDTGEALRTLHSVGSEAFLMGEIVRGEGVEYLRG